MGFIGGLLYALLLSPPRGFIAPRFINIQQGASFEDVAQLLEEEKIIRSSFLLSAFTMLFEGRRLAIAGTYFFPAPQNVVTVAARIGSGDFEVDPVRVTIPEGATQKEIASILVQKLPLFDLEGFLALTEDKEGRLFPDTYFFLPGENPAVIAKALEDNFHARIEEIKSEIVAFKMPLEDIVIMASLLEEEARTYETRRMIAGILWKRIDIGMRLQVDAVFPYIIGKNSFELTTEDLQIDSPYNTYRYAGLPPTAISNPGLSSLKAAVTPVKSSYLYYLSDKEGRMHYASTFEQHVANKRRYLW